MFGLIKKNKKHAIGYKMYKMFKEVTVYEVVV